MIRTKGLLLLLPLSIVLSACTPPQAPVSSPSGDTSGSEQNLNTSMRDLMSMGKSLHCKYSFSDPDTGFETQGSMYISGTRVAQETEIIVPRESSAVSGKMHMITDGVNVYTWDPDKKDSGIKITLDKDKQEQAGDGDVQSGSVDIDKEMEMSCSPWSADESRFVVPPEVNFTDLSQIMQGLPDGIPGMSNKIPNIPAE